MKATAARKEQFCEHLVRGQTPESAAKAVGIDRRTAFRWKASDEIFAARWEEARERKIEAVENLLYRQAMGGDLGAICFFLKAHRPELYNRRQIVAIGGDADNPLTVTHRQDEEVVHLFMPPNHRDEPEEIEADAHDTPEIEGTVSDEADAA